MNYIKYLLGLLLFPIFVFADEKVIDIYTRITGFYSQNLPLNFKAKVDSSDIQKSLNKIPSNMKDSNPEVYLLYSKQLGTRFILTRVNDRYKNHYASYSQIFTLLKPFINTPHFDAFNLEYQLTPLSESRFRLQKRTNTQGNYYEIDYDQKGKMNRITLVENNKKTRSITITYQKVGDFNVFDTIKSTSSNGDKMEFIFSHYQIPFDLQKKDFLG